MTEQEWLDSTDLEQILDFLKGKASERKLRLFACACCRRIPDVLESQPDREGLELTERDVDGLAEKEDFAALPDDFYICDIRWYRRDGWDAVDRARESYRCYLWNSRNLLSLTKQLDADLTELAFDIFGNPFRPVTIPPAILAWNDAVVVRLAQAAYEERHLPVGTLDNTRMAVLADALEESGCTSEDVLGHLRGPGPHVRGCWAIDLCLGKS
jgi:hypothetical protein